MTSLRGGAQPRGAAGGRRIYIFISFNKLFNFVVDPIIS